MEISGFGLKSLGLASLKNASQVASVTPDDHHQEAELHQGRRLIETVPNTGADRKSRHHGQRRKTHKARGQEHEQPGPNAIDQHHGINGQDPADQRRDSLASTEAQVHGIAMTDHSSTKTVRPKMLLGTTPEQYNKSRALEHIQRKRGQAHRSTRGANCVGGPDIPAAHRTRIDSLEGLGENQAEGDCSNQVRRKDQSPGRNCVEVDQG